MYPFDNKTSFYSNKFESIETKHVSMATKHKYHVCCYGDTNSTVSVVVMVTNLNPQQRNICFHGNKFETLIRTILCI